MHKEIALIVGTPTVTGTKIGKLGEVRVVADDGPGSPDGISVHYIIEDHDDTPPAVREQLLVAIIEGAYPQWLDDTPNGDVVDITYEAESANGNNRVVRLETVPIGDGSRLLLSTWTRSTSTSVNAKPQDVILTRDQVMNLVMTLLALYPRLHEAGGS